MGCHVYSSVNCTVRRTESIVMEADVVHQSSLHFSILLYQSYWPYSELKFQEG